LNEAKRLVLMPGLDGSGELFAPLLPLIDRHFDIIVVRYPDLCSFDDYVNHARACLPDGGPVALLAESFSSPVALTLMAEDRSRIGGAVLSAGFACSLRLMPSLDPAAMKHRAVLLQRIDVTPLLAEIKSPVLCLRAGRDRVVPAKHADILLRGLRDARCVDIDGPHLLLQARPRECAAQIIRQLAV